MVVVKMNEHQVKFEKTREKKNEIPMDLYFNLIII